jgi:hypothetical protein
MTQELTAEAAQGDRPAMLLDIDGVFFPLRELSELLNEPVKYSSGFVEHPQYKVVAYNPAHGEWLNRIHQNSADMYWISDWRSDSHHIIGQHFKLPELDWINTDGYNDRKSAGQRRLAITALFGDRPLVWLDDLIRPAERKWGRERNEAGVPTLLVKPNAREGLQPRQMRRIDKWLERLTDQ